jgi:lysophospholipase L1-like esterase
MVPTAGIRRLVDTSIVLNILFGNYVRQGLDRVHNRGVEVACLLMERVAALQRQARLILLAQFQAPDGPPWGIDINNTVLACAEAHSIPTLDLFHVTQGLSLAARTDLFVPPHGHMNAKGNRMVARELMHFLERPSAAEDAHP